MDKLTTLWFVEHVEHLCSNTGSPRHCHY